MNILQSYFVVCMYEIVKEQKQYKISSRNLKNSPQKLSFTVFSSSIFQKSDWVYRNIECLCFGIFVSTDCKNFISHMKTKIL